MFKKGWTNQKMHVMHIIEYCQRKIKQQEQGKHSQLLICLLFIIKGLIPRCTPNKIRFSPVIPVPTALKLVKDAVVFIEWAQLTPEIFMHLLEESLLSDIQKPFYDKNVKVRLCTNIHVRKDQRIIHFILPCQISE